MGFAKKTLTISDDKIFAPNIGECVDATTESHIYQVSTCYSKDLAPALRINILDIVKFIVHWCTLHIHTG